MLLNLDLFDKFGVEPPRDGRWTWDEFLEKMHALTRKDPETGRQYYGLVTNLGPMEYEAYSFIFNRGGRIFQRGPGGEWVSGVTSPAFLKGLKTLVALEYEEKICMPGIGAMTQEQSWNVWRDSRTCACTAQGAWCITAVQVANEAIRKTNKRKRATGRIDEMEPLIRWAIAAPPSDEGTTPVLGSSGLGTYVVFRQKDPRRRDMAVKFAKYLTRAEGQKVLKYENVYPSRHSVGNLWDDTPEIRSVMELFPDGIMSPLIPGTERVDRVLQQEMQKALLKDMSTGRPQVSAEEAVKNADRKIKAMLERARRRFGDRGK
jgi:multiple sugar transport system substrate-binding protein